MTNVTVNHLAEYLGAFRRVHYCCDMVFEHKSMSNNATDFLNGLCDVLVAAGLPAVQTQGGLKLDVQDVLVVAGEVGIAAASRVCCAAGRPAPAHRQRVA